MIQKQGAAISWNSKKQPTAAISSSEAEYQAMAAAVQEVLYRRSLLEEMGVTPEGATVIQEDNQSCIKMCKNPVMQKRTKHIDVKHHFVRERVEDGTVELQYCATEDMCADIMTKTLAKPKLEKHRTQLLGGNSLELQEKVSLSGGVKSRKILPDSFKCLKENAVNEND